VSREPFGTFNNPKVLLFCNPEMNGAKGRIMRGKASSAIDVIKEAAETAASTDTLEAEEALMHHFRLVSSIRHNPSLPYQLTNALG
jgi:hypothetical protein